MPQKHDPNQIPLFVQNEQTGTLRVPSDAIPPVTPPSGDINPLIDSNPGPSVDILERNAHMQNILRRLGEMSRTSGLEFISETGQRRDLEARYDDVDAVVGRASEKSRRQMIELKQEFAAANGLKAMIESDMMTEEEAKAMVGQSFSRELLPVFADARGKNNREAMRRWLNYQERTLTDKRTRRPTVPLPKPPEVV